MKKIMKKSLQKMGIGLIITAIVFMSFPMTTTTAAQLSSASDTLSRVAVSGTGSAVAGYTESATASTEGFIFKDGANDIICFDKDDTASFNATCAGEGNVKVDIIDDGGLIGENIYTGDQVAAAIKTALEAQDGNTDSYTVTYSESDNKFTIQGDGGNTLNTSLGWLTYEGTDDAAASLGYTADNNNIRTTAATSNSAVAFIVLDGVNDKFTIQIDGEDGNAVIDVATGQYEEGAAEGDPETLVAALADAIENDDNFVDADVTVTYASNKFRITSGTDGGNSTIKVVEDGTTDFLKTVKLLGDTPVDGKESSGIVSANHTFVFTATTAVAHSGEIVITFPSGFSIPTDLGFADIDMSANVGGERTLAAAPDGTHDGVVRTSATVLTFTLGTTADNDNVGIEVSGNIAAGTIITIEIGRNADSGVEQIPNPTTIGLYRILVETKTAVPAVIDDAYMAVYIISDDQVVVTATVDPLLSFSVYGGNNIDFGTLQPNAYHKLGGAQSAYGSITLTGVTIDAALDTDTATVRGIIYEFSDDGVIAAASHAKVDIVDNENNYLSAAQAASNLYQAINNYDGDLVRANVSAGSTTVVYVIATTSGDIDTAVEYTITEAVDDGNFSVSSFANDVDGYNQKHTAITYAGGADVGNGQTGTNLIISTNSANGYVITIENTDTTAEADGFTNGTNDINAWGSGTYGYGILASAQSARYGDGTSSIIDSVFQSTGDLPEEMSTTAVTLASYDSTTAGDNIAVEYNVRIGPDQAAGNYSDTVTFVGTATF